MRRMLTEIARIVQTALAEQMGLTVDELVARTDESLDRLGLDSHGLMRVLLDIERALDVQVPLELADEALSTPTTLIAGVVGAVGTAPR